MADVPAVRLVNIVSVTQGTNVYKGVRSVSYSINPGRRIPILEEGDLYPSGSELVGSAEFPVTTSIVFEQSGANMKALLDEAAASLVIVLKKAGGAGSETITITGHQFVNLSVSQNLQDFGRPSINGEAYSVDGDTIPASGV